MKSELIRLLTFTTAVVHVHMFTKRIVRCLFSWVLCLVFVFVGVLRGLFSWMFCTVCFPGCFVRFVFLGVFCDVCFLLLFFSSFFLRSAAEALVMSCVPFSSEMDGKLTGKGRGKSCRYWASRESLVTGSDKN